MTYNSITFSDDKIKNIINNIMDTIIQLTSQNSPPPPSPPPQQKISEINMKINQKHKLNIIPEMEYNKIKNFTNNNIKDNLIINPHIFIFFIITLTLLIIMIILYGYINSNMDI
jgi:hypothetical protein